MKNLLSPWMTRSVIATMLEIRQPVLAWTLLVLFFSVPTGVIAFVANGTASNTGTRLRAETFQRRVDAAAKLRTDFELTMLRQIEFLRGLPDDLDAATAVAELENAPPEYGASFIGTREGEIVLAKPKDPKAAASDPTIAGELGEQFKKRTDLQLLMRTKMIDTKMPIQTTDVGHMWVLSRTLRSKVRVAWLIDPQTIAYTANRTLGDNLMVETMEVPEAPSKGYSSPPGLPPEGLRAVRKAFPEGTKVEPPNEFREKPMITIHLSPPGAGKIGGATAEDATSVIVSETLAARVVLAHPELVDKMIRREQRSIWVLTCVPAFTFVFAIFILFGRARRAQQLADLRTDFVAAVSHELRTPLASVRMFAELLEAGEVPEDERAEVEGALAGETRRLHATLDRMLRYGALARGKLVIDKKQQRLAPIAKEAAKKRDVTLDVPDDLEANVDGGMLGLAIDNLLSNAIKYAPEGGPYLVRARVDGKSVRIDVVDRGPGLSKAAIKKVFMPFERADNRLSKATEGSGVGLALVRGIAQAHGGDASMTSEPGHGATFTLRLPRA